MKVWAHIPGTIKSGFVDVQIGQEATVFRCGSGHSKFGERAHLARVTSQHLVFVTESGAEVKTAADNICDVRGKAEKEGYGISLRSVEEFTDFFHEKVRYWNRKKLCFETK